MREALIESRLANRAKDILNAICWKWVSSRRGVPDRILLLPVPPEHREIVARYVRFVETKSPTGQPSAQQQFVHGLLERQGYKVEVLGTPERVDALVEELKG